MDATYLVLTVVGIIVAAVVLKSRRRKSCVPSFDSWLFERSLQNPNLSLEDGLNEFITTYDLLVRHDIDEPRGISLTRTKVQILERSIIGNPEFCRSDEIQNYLALLKGVLRGYEFTSPEVRKLLKEKEPEQ